MIRVGRLAAASVGVALALGGCVEKGDFGRVRTNSTWNDALAATGSIVAAYQGEPVSSFGLTDDEGEFRNRAWRFLVPAKDRPWFDAALASLAAKRILPPGTGLGDRTAYFDGLQADGARSPASRYRRLGDDAAADLRLMPALVETARRVATADGIRLKTLRHATTANPDDAAEANTRVAENRCLMAWVRAGFEVRLAAYAYALEHLVIETPQADAVPAERTLASLERARAAFAGFDIPPLAFCAGEPAPVPAQAAPLVRKG